MFFDKKETIVHFIGIGGIGMSGIAEVLLNLGFKVQGSDIARGGNVAKLESLGCRVFIGHQKQNVEDAGLVVVSSAINGRNPELREAKERGLPIIKRAEMLAELMRLKNGIAVAGTHGKTTTTSILATILHGAGLDPTHIIGGVVKNLGGHAKLGKSEFLIAEADESDGSFLLLSPIFSIITNIDFDHMDHYGSEKKLLNSFIEFSNRIPFYGWCSVSIHDPNIGSIRKKIKKQVTTFGLKNRLSDDSLVPDYMAANIELIGDSSRFDLYHKGENVGPVEIGIIGEHNVLNTLAAISIAHKLDLSFEKISDAVKAFNGVGRRLERLYQNGTFEIVDDYAHHPTEIAATLSSLKSKGKKVVAIFEPHRFSRTRDCWTDFFHCFNSADELYLLPIYPASERQIAGITSDRLSADIAKIHPNFSSAISHEEFEKTIDRYQDDPETILVTMGAGSIGKRIRSAVAR